MFTIIISVAIALALSIGLPKADIAAIGWGIFWGIVGFIASMAVIGRVVSKKVQVVMLSMQSNLMNGQNKLMARAKQFQFRPVGDPHREMAKMQAEQSKLFEAALEETKQLDHFRNWMPFFSRQICTIQIQFHYQLKHFDEVDALLKKALVLDPVTATIKLARQYSNKAPLAEMEKTFRSGKVRSRYDQSALLFGLMSWIYMKEKKVDEAFQTLENGCKVNSVEEGPASTLKRNRDLLANNRVKEFSNAGFGDQWYALFLEEPRIRYERRPAGRFGKFGY